MTAFRGRLAAALFGTRCECGKRIRRCPLGGSCSVGPWMHTGRNGGHYCAGGGTARPAEGGGQ